MIISNDGKIVLCTPTKVGSTSLEKVILDDYKVGRRLYGDEANGMGASQTRGYKHGSVCKLAVKNRILLVRHPLARFASIFAFLRNSKGNFDNELVRAARKNMVEEFCNIYLESKETVWTKQLVSYVDEFQPNEIYKLEENGIYHIAKKLGVKLEEVPYINRTNHGGWKQMSMILSKPVRRKIKEIHKDSIKLLRYNEL